MQVCRNDNSILQVVFSWGLRWLGKLMLPQEGDVTLWSMWQWHILDGIGQDKGMESYVGGTCTRVKNGQFRGNDSQTGFCILFLDWFLYLIFRLVSVFDFQTGFCVWFIHWFIVYVLDCYFPPNNIMEWFSYGKNGLNNMALEYKLGVVRS